MTLAIKPYHNLNASYGSNMNIQYHKKMLKCCSTSLWSRGRLGKNVYKTPISIANEGIPVKHLNVASEF